jgi:capsule polysaccharide export protein KpsE/RkpR
MVKDFVSIANDLAVKVFSTEATLNRQHLERRIEQTDSVLAVIADSLQQSSRKNLMFDPESQAKAVSTALIDMNAEKIKQEVVLELLKDRYGATDSYTKMQENIVNQLAQHLNDAKNKPGFAGEFSLRDAGKIGIQYMNYYVLYETFSKVRSFLMPMLEEARLDEMKQVQNLYIIDEPTRPDKKSRPKRSLFIAGALFGSFVFSIMIVIVTYRILIFRKKLNDYYA